MSRPPYRVLRIVLGIFSFLAAAGGLLLIFSGKPLVLRLFLRPPESEVSTLLLIMAKEMGGLILMLSVMLFFAYRDPARNVAIVNAFIVRLCVLAISPLSAFIASGNATAFSQLTDLGALHCAF